MTAATRMHAQAELDGEPMSRRALLGTPRYLTMVGAFSIGLMAQISFIAHQAAFLEPTLGLKGAGWALSVTALSAADRPARRRRW